MKQSRICSLKVSHVYIFKSRSIQCDPPRHNKWTRPPHTIMSFVSGVITRDLHVRGNSLQTR